MTYIEKATERFLQIRVSRRQAGIGVVTALAAPILEACAPPSPATSTPSRVGETPLVVATWKTAPEARRDGQTPAANKPTEPTPNSTLVVAATRYAELQGTVVVPKAGAGDGVVSTPTVTVTRTPEVVLTRTPVPTESKRLESKELVWGSEDEYYVAKWQGKPFGDRTSHMVIQVERMSKDGKGEDLTTVTHVLVQKGHVLRILPNGVDEWAGADWHVWGPEPDVVERMYGMRDEVIERDSKPGSPVKPYMLYVGDGPAPKDFTKDIPTWGENWRVEKFPDLSGAARSAAATTGTPEAGRVSTGELKFDEKKVDFRGNPVVLKSDKDYGGVAVEWDGKDVASTKVLVLEKGVELTIPERGEGSYWKQVSGSPEQLARRGKEMTSELKASDPTKKDLNIKAYYVGKGQVPEGLEKAPEGWKVQ